MDNIMSIEIGLTYTSKCVVEESRTALVMGSGDLAVFATPSMVALMENAAMNCVGDHLPDGSTTVGTKIEVAHVRATPLTVEVEAKATVVEVDGRKLVFKVEAFDAKGVVGEGMHERFIVDRDKFLSRL